MEYCSVRLELKAPENLDPAESFNGKVAFTPDIARGDVWNGDGSITPSVRVDAYIVDNNLQGSDGKKLVTLMAGGTGVNPEKVYWRIAFDDLYIGDQRVHIDPFVFEAIPGAVLDLSEVTPVAGYTPPGIIRGLKGDPGFSFKGVFNKESELPASSEKGDAWANLSTKDLYIWNGSKWEVVTDFGKVDVGLENINEYVNQAEQYSISAKTSETNSKNHEANSLTYAKRAEFAAEETIQQVEGDFATRNYVDESKWQKGLLYTNNLDALLTPGVYAQPNSNWATLANGYPEQTRGTLTVSSWDTADPGRVYQVFTATYYNRVWMRERVNGAWAEWVNFLAGSFQVHGDLNYRNLNDVLSPGVYKQPLSARATAARNYPQATRGILTVHQWGDESQVSQTYQATFRGDVYTREHSATGWEEWMRIAGDTPTSNNDSQLNHRRDAMKQVSRMRRGGVIGTNGATPVSLSFDHGYVNFRDKVLPHLRRLGLPCTSAFNQGQLGSGENEGISWPQLQEIGLNYGVEFAHHGYSHTDISDASTNVERITNALTSSIELVKNNMSEIVADAFILPGVGGTNYDGFDGGAEPESWWDHPAGRALMQHFPVVSAKRKGHAIPLMQGEDLSFGSDRFGWDTAEGADTLKGHIQSLSGTTMGVKCFMHPSQIDLAGKISEAKLVETLEWMASERDAGRIEVLTVSGFAYADVTSNVRMNIAPSWTSDQAVISLTPMMGYLAGAQVLVETTAETSGTLTISATSDTGGLDSSVTHTTTAGRRYGLVFSIPKSAKTITIAAPGKLRSARIV